MEEILRTVRAELRSAWRYRWHALGVAWAICVLGWLAVYLTPDTYEARARFYLDTTSAIEPFVQQLSVGVDVNQQVDLVRQVVLGRDALLNVARETDLAIKAANPTELEALLEDLGKNITLTGGLPSRANPREIDRNFEIAYRDTNRERAVKVVQIVLDSFIEDTLKIRSKGYQSAQDFLEKQVRQQEQRLAEAEQKLADFKRKNLGNLPTEQGSYVTSVQTQMNELQNLRSQQRMLQSRRAQLTAQLSSEKQYVPSSSVPSTQGNNPAAGSNELDSLILQQQARLEELLRVYTPKHPEVVALEETLAQLRAQRREQLAKMGITDMPERGSLVANPVYDQIRLQRNQVDVDLAAVNGQIADRMARIQEMRSRMETMPEVEAELAQLTRDYDVLRERYAALLQQLETAKLSDAVGQTDAVDFSILNPPTALADPVAPPRLLLLIGVLVLGLAAGGAAAFLMSRLNPVFDSLTSLETVTGLPVLGAVSATWLDKHRLQRRHELARVAMAGAALIVLFAVVLAARDVGSHFLHTLTG
jgi:polysaccharide chain length determinant protein (PEP-CTERM system associated)